MPTSSHVMRMGGYRDILASATLAAAALACKAPDASFNPDDMTPWEAILAETPEDGRFTLEQSRQAFSLLIAPLPNVEIPEGVNPERALATGHDYGALGGTPALNSLLGYWDELDPEEQEIVQATLLPLEEAIGGATRADSPTLVQFKQLAADSPTLVQFKQLAMDAELAIGAASGLGPLGVPVRVAMMDTSGWDGKILTYAFAAGVDETGQVGGPGAMKQCFIGVHLEAVPLSQVQRQLVMTHELFHCYQRKISGSARVTQPLWISEGSAEWVAHEIIGEDSVIYSGQQWHQTPERTVSARSYDSVGLLHEVQYLGNPIWPLIQNLCRSTTTAEGLSYLVNPIFGRLQNSWAASLHRWDSWGYEWTMTGRGVLPLVGNPSTTIMDIASPGSIEVISVKPWAAQVLMARTAGELVDVNVTGYVRVADSPPPGNADILNPRWLCTATDCNCPDGSPLPMVVEQVKPPLLFGITGWSDGASGTISGHKIEDFCVPDPPSPAHLEPAQPPPCQVPEGNFCTIAAALEETTTYVIRNSLGHPDWFEESWTCHVSVARAANAVAPAAVSQPWGRILQLYNTYTTPLYEQIGWDLHNVVVLGTQSPEEFISNRMLWEAYEVSLGEYMSDLEAGSTYLSDDCHIDWLEL